MSREFDSPWTEVWELLFREALEWFAQDVYSDADWSKSFDSLDTELQKILREAELGKRIGDKLFRMHLKNGKSLYLLIHVEIQSQVDPELEERIFVFSYRIRDRYNTPLVSLVILGDEDADWRPTEFSESVYGCQTVYRFRQVKLIDFRNREEELETSANPIGLMILAHLKSLETKDQPEARYQAKWRLIRLLYDRGWDAETVRKFFRLIDWFLELPEALKNKLDTDIRNYEAEKQMPYITSIERSGIEKGRREGIIEGIEDALDVRFGADGLALMEQVRKIADVGRLRELHRELLRGIVMENFRDSLQKMLAE